MLPFQSICGWQSYNGYSRIHHCQGDPLSWIIKLRCLSIIDHHCQGYPCMTNNYTLLDDKGFLCQHWTTITITNCLGWCYHLWYWVASIILHRTNPKKSIWIVCLVYISLIELIISQQMTKVIFMLFNWSGFTNII